MSLVQLPLRDRLRILWYRLTWVLAGALGLGGILALLVLVLYLFMLVVGIEQ